LNAQWLNALSKKVKFLRLWGHSGGVLTEKIKWYPSKYLERNKEILQFLGQYKELKNQPSPKGIESAWIYLNPDKWKGEIKAESLANQVNLVMPIDQEFSWSIQFPATGIMADKTDAEVMNQIETNYKHIFESRAIDGTASDEIARMLSKYILLNVGDRFEVEYGELSKSTYTVLLNVLGEVTDVESTIKYLKHKYKARYETRVSYSLDFKVKRISAVLDDDPFIRRLSNAKSAETRAAALKLQELEPYIGADHDNDGFSVSISLGTHFAKKRVTNEYFLNGQLRTDVFSIKTMKSKDCNILWSSIIDSDFKKKKTKWYSKLLAIVVVVAVAWVTGGSSLGAMAWGAAIGALAGAVLSMAMTEWGDYSGAGFASKMSALAGKVSNIIGVLNILGNTLSTLTSEATKKTLMEKIKSMVIAKFNQLTQLTLKNVFRWVAQGLNLYMKNDLKKDQSAIESKQSALDKEQLAEESTKNPALLAAMVNAPYMQLAGLDAAHHEVNSDYKNNVSIFNIGTWRHSRIPPYKVSPIDTTVITSSGKTY